MIALLNLSQNLTYTKYYCSYHITEGCINQFRDTIKLHHEQKRSNGETLQQLVHHG